MMKGLETTPFFLAQILKHLNHKEDHHHHETLFRNILYIIKKKMKKRERGKLKEESENFEKGGETEKHMIAKGV